MIIYNLTRYCFYVEGNYFLLHGWMGTLKFKSPFYIYLLAEDRYLEIFSSPFILYNDFWKIAYKKVLYNIIGKITHTVSYGHFIKLRIRGRGYRILKDINNLVLRLGYSHKINYLVSLPVCILPYKGYKRDVPWKFYGLQGDLVRNACYVVHSFRKPDIYCRLGIYMYKQPIIFKQGIKPYRL